MYQLRTKGGKRDPVKQWALPDRVLFACGACHILAYAFLTEHACSQFRPVWIRPHEGYTGNHIVVVRDNCAFDYHGYSRWSELLAHMRRKANRWWPGWCADLIDLPRDVLISEALSRQHGDLWLKEPAQYLHNPLPRARAFVLRYPAPGNG